MSNFVSSPVANILSSDGTIKACHILVQWQPHLRFNKLGDLALHNFIEHDASLVHDDTAAGETLAPTTVNQTKVQTLLANYPNSEGKFSYLEFAYARADVEKVTPISSSFGAIAAGEPSLILHTLGVGAGANLTVTKAQVASIFGLERLPIGFVKQTQPVTLPDVVAVRKLIVAKIAELNAPTPA